MTRTKFVTSIILIVSLSSCSKNDPSDSIEQGRFLEYEEFSSNIAELVTCVYFIDNKNGFATTYNENILKTIDGGKTWKILKNSPSEIRFIHFSDFVNGIAIGYGHYTGGCFGTMTKAIYWINDGGLTWKIEDNIEFDSVSSFFNRNV